MDSADLHDWVAEYNWDDGLAPMWAIAEHPRTQHSTALLMYWRLGGPWLESDASAVNTEARRLQAVVRERLLAGTYPVGPSSFDPTEEVSAARLERLRRSGVPAVLLGG
jgi:hypothetical protein